MHKHLTAEEYLADRPQPLRGTGEMLLAAVEAALPGARESMRGGHPSWSVDGRDVCLVKAFTRHLTLALPRGARVEDPTGRLNPTGTKEVAAVKLRTPEDVEALPLADWLAQARELAGAPG